MLLDPVGGFATLVWPAAGIALAALLLFGTRLWPGVAAGAFLANLSAGAPVLVASAIAAGNTLEAVIANHLLRRVVGFRLSLPRVVDVMALALLAAGTSTLVAATLGASALTLGGVIDLAQFGATWLAWWLGDAIGILIVTPLILTWATSRHLRLSSSRALEAVALVFALVITSWLIFGQSAVAQSFWRPYMLAPIFIWATLRFDQRGAATAVFLVSVIATWGTALGMGQFANGPLHERLLPLQTFMAVTVLTFLVLGAMASERKHAEQQLRLAKEKAEAANLAKSQFLAVTSHELRTPLTGIVGYADLLAEEIDAPLSEKQRWKVGRIKAASWHLISIIDSILSFARAEAGREEIKWQTVDATERARNAAALLEPEAKSKGLAIHVNAPESPVEVVTDPGKLDQILLNLLSNAVKFSESGAIHFTVRPENGWVAFEVRDQGPGIEAEQMQYIFEPFTQIDQTATRVKGGTGLGLTVARTFAQLLNGTIEVESHVGSGSTFTLRIPTRAPFAKA